MKYRYLTLILPILISLSLIGVGFSAWTISGLEEESIEGNITSDKVLDSREYITNTSIECFDYSQYGYLDSNGYLTSKGTIVANYSINLKECKGLFTDNSLVMVLRLQYADGYKTNLNLFGEIKSTTDPQGTHNINAAISHNISNANVNIKGEPISNLTTQQYSYQITFENILSNYYKETDTSTHTLDFTITYTLTSDVGLFFYENIYNYLYTDFLNQNSNLYFEIESYLTDY